MRPLSFAVAALVMGVALGLSPPALANGDMCTESQELDKHRLLRRLSLDLRQQVPSYDEYRLLDTEEEVPEWIVDQWLGLDDGDPEDSEPFRLAMRRFHSDLLLPNVIGVQLNSVSTSLRIFEIGGSAIWDVNSTGRRNKWRGSTQGPNCGDWPQSDLGYMEVVEDGTTFTVPVSKEVEDSKGDVYAQDGWVEMAPYWAPETTIKICAFALMNNETGGKPYDQLCESPYGVLQKFCGCGSDLRWCYGDRKLVEQRIWAAMSEQVGRLFDTVSVGGRPYTDLVLTSSVWTNGTLDFWNKYMAPLMSIQRTADLTGPGDAPLPEAPSFLDDTWVERERGWPHGGVQTLAAYTLRFNTNKARANRFRIVFTNQYFIPPASPSAEECDPVDPADGCCTPDAEDLTERCVCQDCHQVVEPLAAYWAYHAESGSGLLTDSEVWFPEYNDQCDPSPGTAPTPALMGGFCDRFYVTEEGEGIARPGYLRALQYAVETDGNPVHASIAVHAKAGPGGGVNPGEGQTVEEKGYAQSVVDTGIWHQAMVRNLWRHLMGRDMTLGLDDGDPDNERELLADLADDLNLHDSLPQLVKTLVSLDHYRRVR